MASHGATGRVVVGIDQHLPMRGLYMIELRERLDGRLPVRVNDSGPIPGEAELLELVFFAARAHGLEKFLERLAIRVHIDEHPTAPDSRPHFVQPHGAGGQTIAPVLFIHDLNGTAVEVVAPAVERADELPGAPASLCQLVAAMRTHVVERFDAVLGRADDDDRVLENIVSDVAADAREFLQATGKLPDLRPELLRFGAGEIRIQVVFFWNEVVTDFFRRELA